MSADAGRRKDGSGGAGDDSAAGWFEPRSRQGTGDAHGDRLRRGIEHEEIEDLRHARRIGSHADLEVGRFEDPRRRRRGRIRFERRSLPQRLEVGQRQTNGLGSGGRTARDRPGQSCRGEQCRDSLSLHGPSRRRSSGVGPAG
jgi:hypothetical protein